MSANLRQLGKNGPKVPPIGLGLMGLSQSVYGAVDDDEKRFKFLDRAHELGQRFWDTSDLYGDGEELLGKWFKRTGKRNDIFLSTKFGFVKGSKTYEVDSSSEYCKKACEESLRALGIDTIDLYYAHHVSPKTPIEETMRVLVELQREGKIKYIGLSAVSSATVRRAVKIAHVDAIQMDYSPFVRDIENDKGTNLLDTCRELGIAIIAAMPLGRGMVTSTFANGTVDGGNGTDVRQTTMPRFSDQNRPNNVGIVKQFGTLAQTHGCSVSQLALAWLLHQGADIIPIPGTKKIEFLEENWEARNIQLSGEEEAATRKFVEAAEVAGNTLPPAFESYNYVNTIEES